MSPLVDEDGVLYVHLGDDTEGELFAADLETGEVRWSWDGQGPSYTSPMLVEVDGTRQLVTMGATDILGLDADTGALLWSRPFEDEWNQNIVTPLVVGERILFADVENGTVAVWPERSDDAETGWTLREHWHHPELTQYMASPVTDGERVIGFTNQRKGQLFVLDPATGDVTWRSEGRGGRNASLTLAGDHLLVASTDAELSVWRLAGDALEPVETYEIADSAVWAHPAWLEDGLLIKDAEHLIRLQLG